jgi:hypothetical protein
MFDARPQEPLGAFDATNGAAQRGPQFANVFRRAIGQIFLGLCPNELVRIELGRVSRKPMNMKPILAGQELLDDVSPVDGAAIPNEFHVAPQVTQEMAQELAHFHHPAVSKSRERCSGPTANFNGAQNQANCTLQDHGVDFTTPIGGFHLHSAALSEIFEGPVVRGDKMPIAAGAESRNIT